MCCDLPGRFYKSLNDKVQAMLVFAQEVTIIICMYVFILVDFYNNIIAS